MLAIIGLTSNESRSIILTHYDRKNVDNSLISDVIMSMKMIQFTDEGQWGTWSIYLPINWALLSNKASSADFLISFEQF